MEQTTTAGMPGDSAERTATLQDLRSRTGLKSLDKIAICVSLIALAFAIFTFFMEFIYADKSFYVSSYDLIINNTMENNEYFTRFVVSNSGDVPLNISNIHFCLANIENAGVEITGSAKSWTAVDTRVNGITSGMVRSSVVPLRPNEVKTFDLTSSFIAPAASFSNKRFFAGVCFETYTSSAEEVRKNIMPFVVDFDHRAMPTHGQRADHFDIAHRRKFSQ